MTSFLGRVADWTVLKPVSGGFTVLPVCGASDDAYFSNILASLPFGDSRLGPILPLETSFALAMPVSQPEMRQAVERYQDASVKLTRYKRTLEELRKASGKDPVKWEKELGIQEIARVHFEGGASCSLPSSTFACSATVTASSFSFTSSVFAAPS